MIHDIIDRGNHHRFIHVNTLPQRFLKVFISRIQIYAHNRSPEMVPLGSRTDLTYCLYDSTIWPVLPRLCIIKDAFVNLQAIRNAKHCPNGNNDSDSDA